MKIPKVCLTLTENTIEANLALIERYRKYIDLVELRADYLDEDELLHIRRFPQMAGIDCILTIRRKRDGGVFEGGEASRTMLFARAMAFADDQHPENNFKYVDFEDDFLVPSLQDAALAFGTKIIRSFHSMNAPVSNLIRRCDEMRRTGFEIPKIAFMPNSLEDVKNLFYETRSFTKYDHIICAMGTMGFVSRVLAFKTHSFLTYTSAADSANSLKHIGQVDPEKMVEKYRIRELNDSTEIFGITGWPLLKTASPALHNEGYKAHSLNAVYIPVPSPDVHQAFSFAEAIGMKGLSVTVPHKEAVIGELYKTTNLVGEIGACNTVVKRGDEWHGFNTDVTGFIRALLEFTGLKNLRKKHVAIIGAGGASHAVAYAIKKLGARACVFNRTLERAVQLADMFGFEYAQLIPESIHQLERYSELIIQTSSVGMNSNEGRSGIQNDPLYFYRFKGNEVLFDLIYTPAVTPVMERAIKAGCKVCNGEAMLRYQGYDQFKIFTGIDYEDAKPK